MSLAPRTATIRPGQVLLLQASLVDELGRVSQGVAMAWRSSNQAVATVSSAGEVRGMAEGHAVITASAQGRAQSSTIHVVRAPKPNIDKGPFY